MVFFLASYFSFLILVNLPFYLKGMGLKGKMERHATKLKIEDLFNLFRDHLQMRSTDVMTSQMFVRFNGLTTRISTRRTLSVFHAIAMGAWADMVIKCLIAVDADFENAQKRLFWGQTLYFFQFLFHDLIRQHCYLLLWNTMHTGPDHWRRGTTRNAIAVFWFQNVHDQSKSWRRAWSGFYQRTLRSAHKQFIQICHNPTNVDIQRYKGSLIREFRINVFVNHQNVNREST